MSRDVLEPFDLAILPDCNIIWANGIWQNANNLLKLCSDTTKVKQFIDECIKNIRNPAKSKVVWNTQIHSFQGENYGLVWYFNSEIIKRVIKIALKIDPEFKTIVIGVMNIAPPKESHKCLAHVNRKINE